MINKRASVINLSDFEGVSFYSCMVSSFSWRKKCVICKGKKVFQSHVQDRLFGWLPFLHVKSQVASDTENKERFISNLFLFPT